MLLQYVLTGNINDTVFSEEQIFSSRQWRDLLGWTGKRQRGNSCSPTSHKKRNSSTPSCERVENRPPPRTGETSNQTCVASAVRVRKKHVSATRADLSRHIPPWRRPSFPVGPLTSRETKPNYPVTNRTSSRDGPFWSPAKRTCTYAIRNDSFHSRGRPVRGASRRGVAEATARLDRTYVKTDRSTSTNTDGGENGRNIPTFRFPDVSKTYKPLILRSVRLSFFPAQRLLILFLETGDANIAFSS